MQNYGATAIARQWSDVNAGDALGNMPPESLFALFCVKRCLSMLLDITSERACRHPPVPEHVIHRIISAAYHYMTALEEQCCKWDEEVAAQRRRIMEAEVALRKYYTEVESRRRQLRRDRHHIRKTQEELREAHHCLERLRKSAYTTKSMSLASRLQLKAFMSLLPNLTLNAPSWTTPLITLNDSQNHHNDPLPITLKESLKNCFMASPMNVSPNECHHSSPHRVSPPIPALCYSRDTYADTITDKEVILFVFPCSFQAEYLSLPERIHP